MRVMLSISHFAPRLTFLKLQYKPYPRSEDTNSIETQDKLPDHTYVLQIFRSLTSILSYSAASASQSAAQGPKSYLNLLRYRWSEGASTLRECHSLSGYWLASVAVRRHLSY